MNTTTTILNHNQIVQKIKRIAYQIYEANSFENEIIIAFRVMESFLQKN
jgi:pyrimidine operon attenuation protein/uracil phosphoribosyltransferase